MAQAKQPLDLKGRDGRWTGMSDRSSFAPTTGAFSLIRNAYVSADGTEIRRMPPLTLWADPILAQGPIGIVAMTAGYPTLVTFAQDHYLAETGMINSLGYRVYVKGNGVLADGWYPLVRNGSDRDAAIDVRTESTSLLGGWALERSTTVHGMQMVGNRLCVLSESLMTMVDPDGANIPMHSVAVWVSQAPLDWEHPVISPFEYWMNVLNHPDNQALSCSLPASGATPAVLTIKHGYARVGSTFYVDVAGLAGSGVADGDYYATVVEPYQTASLAGTTNNGTGATGTAVLSFAAFSRPVRRRCQTDVADGRLLIAAPGEGVCYQAHVGNLDAAAALSVKRTRLLGIPKGVIVSATQTTGGLLADGIYQVAICYLDPRTGESGLISETYDINITAGGGTAAILLTYHTPRAVLRECYGCTVVVYISDVNAGPGTMKPTMEIAPALFTVSVTEQTTITTTGVEAKEIPVIENLPMGATSVCTLKGITFFSGLIASPYALSNLAAEPVRVSTGYLGRNEITFTPLNTVGATAVTGSPAADHQVPNSYGGLGLQYQNYALTTLDKKLNAPVDAGPSLLAHYQHWSVRGVHELSTDQSSNLDGQIVMPRGIVWYTEQGHPGIAPSTNRTVVDRLQGYDVVGLGRWKDNIVAATDKETYLIPWDRSPLGSDPRGITSEHGCIAPSSMTQFEDGLGWLGERGPVALWNGRMWIGDSIYETWKTLKRDSRGLMLHAFGAHDPQRKLLLFFVRTDRNLALYVNQANDDAKSKVACDTVLVYSYPNDAWSVWELPADREAVDARMVLCNDGLYRFGILTSTRLIYAFDEDLNVKTSPIEVELHTKRYRFGQLNDSTKVGAVDLRVQTETPDSGFTMSCFAVDDDEREVSLAPKDAQQVYDKRTRCEGGAMISQDFLVKMRFLGSGTLRIKDITLEVSPGG